MVLEKRSIAVSEDHRHLVDMAGPNTKFGSRTAEIMRRYRAIIDDVTSVEQKFAEDQLQYIYRLVSTGTLDLIGRVPISVQLEWEYGQDKKAIDDKMPVFIPEDGEAMVATWQQLSRGEEFALIEKMERIAARSEID